MLDGAREYFLKLMHDIAGADTQLVLLIILIVSAIMVLDALSSFARKKRRDTGFENKVETVSIDGSRTIPVRNYVSEIQGLAGRPDAVINELGNFIPVERKPLARKIRDRYVAQLLVYMRLVEEFEGKKPPYGYLILGPSCRKFKIDNTPERQAWLQKHLDEMRAILEGAEARPDPHPRKCHKCDVKEACKHRIDAGSSNLTTISPAKNSNSNGLIRH